MNHQRLNSFKAQRDHYLGKSKGSIPKDLRTTLSAGPVSPASHTHRLFIASLAALLVGGLMSAPTSSAFAQSGANYRAETAGGARFPAGSCEAQLQETRELRLAALGGAPVGAWVAYVAAQRSFAASAASVRASIPAVTQNIAAHDQKLQSEIDSLDWDRRLNEVRRRRFESAESFLQNDRENFARNLPQTKPEQASGGQGTRAAQLASLRDPVDSMDLQKIQYQLGQLKHDAEIFKNAQSDFLRFLPNNHQDFDQVSKGKGSIAIATLTQQTTKSNAQLDKLTRHAEALEATLEKVQKIITDSQANGTSATLPSNLHAELTINRVAVGAELEIADRNLRIMSRALERVSDIRQATLTLAGIAINDRVAESRERHRTATESSHAQRQAMGRQLDRMRKLPKLLAGFGAVAGSASLSAGLLAWEIYRAPTGAELSSIKEINLSPEVLLHPMRSPKEMCDILRATGPSAVSEASERLSELQEYGNSVENTGRYRLHERSVTVDAGRNLSPHLAVQPARPPQLLMLFGASAQ